jgi:hypothetical protein
MATISQLPAPVTLRKFRGDELDVTLDFDIDLTGYTFSNDIYRLEPVAVGGGVTSTQAVSYGSFTVTVVSPASGQVRLSLSESASEAIDAGSYRWYFRWVAPGTVTRTVLNGTLEIVDDILQASGLNSDGQVITVAAADAVGGGGGGGGTLPAAGLLNEILWG